MDLQANDEEILEAIWVAAENKEYSLKAIKRLCTIDIKDEALSRFEQMSLIVRSGDKILFSNKGKKTSEAIVRRCRLAKVLLSTILKLKDSAMREIACKIEHSLLPEVEESICTLLGHPDMCPDGQPIPKGSCCGKANHIVDSVIVSLKELKPSQSGKVTYIRPGNHSELHQLISLGLTPGVIVTVHQTSPACCIKFENTELALDDQIAENIFVLRAKS